MLVRNQFNVPRGFVDRSHLLESVHRCLASLEADRVKDYARHFELDKARMNLVVQEMVDSEKAGVLFTADPNKGSDILIEAVSGLITEIGSSLSHGAVVAREYGLPTIVNVKGATQVLKDGDHILMDAEKGLMTRVL